MAMTEKNKKEWQPPTTKGYKPFIWPMAEHYAEALSERLRILRAIERGEDGGG